MKCFYIYDSPVGILELVEEDNFLVKINFEAEQEKIGTLKETELLKEVHKQLTEYFCETRKEFSLSINLVGTLFQNKVWKELQTIPYGKTMTYQEIAQKIGNRKASRAVGLANNKNPLPIIIPCHRVIGKDGKLTGYRGGLTAKQYLITLENMSIKENTGI